MDCFVAGIVKGIAEAGDATRYFGSLLSFSGHMRKAKSCGLVVDDDSKALTELGRRYYEAANLQALPKTRAYSWPHQDWGVLLTSNTHSPTAESD